MLLNVEVSSEMAVSAVLGNHSPLALADGAIPSVWWCWGVCMQPHGFLDQ